MTKQTNPDLSASLSKLDGFLEDYLVKKTPAIPKQIKELIVDYGPYLIIVSLLFAIPSILALFGLSTLSSSFRSFGRLGYGFNLTFSTIVWLISLVIEAVALPGLLKKKASAWKLMYYVTLVNAVYSLLTVNIVGFLIGTILSFYILFQIKSYYK